MKIFEKYRPAIQHLFDRFVMRIRYIRCRMHFRQLSEADKDMFAYLGMDPWTKKARGDFDVKQR